MLVSFPTYLDTICVLLCVITILLVPVSSLAVTLLRRERSKK